MTPMSPRVAAVVSAFLADPVDPSCAAWFATCKAANSPYAQQQLAKERERRDAALEAALGRLEATLRELMAPYASRVCVPGGGRWYTWDAERLNCATCYFVRRIDDVLYEIEKRAGGPLEEKQALARDIEAALTQSAPEHLFSPLQALIEEAFRHFRSEL
jgi:hypothetical protein